MDELQLDIAPVLLGSGLRLLEHLAPAAVGLTLAGIDQLGDRASLRYALRR